MYFVDLPLDPPMAFCSVATAETHNRSNRSSYRRKQEEQEQEQ
jgi:hypothetical protein